MDKTSFCLILLFLCLIQAETQKVINKDILDIEDDTEAFEEFKKRFGKIYATSEEEQGKKNNFKKNLETLRSINCGSSCSVTQYFDKSDNQLQNMKGLKVDDVMNYPNIVRIKANENSQENTNSLKKDNSKDDVEAKSSTKSTSTTSSTAQTTVSVGAYPLTLDYRINQKVTPVRDQGNCGSCWAFAAVAFFQSQIIRTRGVAPATLNLAEQFLLKCDSGSRGCNGGNCLSSSSLVISNGLPLEGSYPYNPTKNYRGICKARPAYTFTGARLIYYSGTKLSDDQIIAYLQTRPVMIYVTAAYWHMYSFTNNRTFSCRSTESTSSSTLDHAVLLVGYTETEWIIKNSWGTSYGDAGYIYVSRTPSANCGIGFFVASLA